MVLVPAGSSSLELTREGVEICELRAAAEAIFDVDSW